MKVYKIELMVIDLDVVGEEGIKEVIENQKYPNHCIDPHVKNIEGRDIGEWHDDHPLNKRDQSEDYFRRLFEK